MQRAGGTFADEAMAESTQDVNDGFSLGPFYTHDDVSTIVGTDRWIGTERFTIEQKGKLRNIDSATASMINPATSITEQLDIASTDGNIAMIRRLKSAMPFTKILGWVLDEKNAYRWIPIKPEQRRYAVICVYDKARSSIAYFVMIGHPFGMRSAVYNYNRRSLILNTILRKEFDVLSSFYYDDKFAFEPEGACDSSYLAAVLLRKWVGTIFNQKKMTMGTNPIILGVHYNLDDQLVSITEERKKSILSSIQDILQSGRLGSGQAGKLKGKLSFASMQLWGKVGRAFLRCLSERQYSSAPIDSINVAIGLALREWTWLTISGTPRPIQCVSDSPADVVIFTDEYFPNPMLGETGQARVGGVIFDRCRSKPMVFSLPITDSMMSNWIQRKTQISMIELFAPVLAMEFLSTSIVGRSALFLIDSESVEGALIKGYSAMSDICELVGIFWRMADIRSVTIYVDRVSTDANIADGPSRNDPRFWFTVHDLGWHVFDTWIPDYLGSDSSFKGLGS